MIAGVAWKGCAFAFDRRDRSAAGNVEGIADERVTEGRRVNSNLVRTARDDGDLDEGVAGFGVDVDTTTLTARSASIGCGGVELTDGRVVDGADGCVDDECVRYVDALDECAINFGDSPLDECFRHDTERLA